MTAFRKARPDLAFCAAHSAAELYAVMTRLPVRPPISAEQGVLFLESLRERATWVALREREYLAAITEAARLGAVGGRTYDALILRCARKARADVIYTLNLRDFALLAPDLAERIRTP